MKYKNCICWFYFKGIDICDLSIKFFNFMFLILMFRMIDMDIRNVL